jgi:hypothetical protein
MVLFRPGNVLHTEKSKSSVVHRLWASGLNNDQIIKFPDFVNHFPDFGINVLLIPFLCNK